MWALVLAHGYGPFSMSIKSMHAWHQYCIHRPAALIMSIEWLCSSPTCMSVSSSVQMHCSGRERQMTYACMASVLDMHVNSTGLIVASALYSLHVIENNSNARMK